MGFISCWRDEKSARADCFKNNVGEYKIDLKRTSEGNQGLGPYADDSDRLSNFHILFRKHSTFKMNMRVEFVTDTIGMWDSGSCGFEDPRTVSYFTSKSVEQFGPCDTESGYCTKLSPYTSKYGSLTLWFKRCPKDSVILQ